MFSFSKKLSENLKQYMLFNNYRNYRVLIKYTNFPETIIKKINNSKCEFIRNIETCKIICASLNKSTIIRLSEYPETKHITLDSYFHLCGINVSSANKIRLSNRFLFTGKNIGIGIVDSGVYPHSDLTAPFNKISTFVDLINNYELPYDDNGHGTCTSGIICGTGFASNKIYKGIAPDSNIHCYKAFDKLGKGFISDIFFSIEELIKLSSQKNIKVICLPFELLYFDYFVFENFDKLMKKCIDNNIIPIVPSGSNQNIAGSLTGISLSSNCITVSGLNTTHKEIIPYNFSSCGSYKNDSKPDFASACVDIVSLNCNTSYIPMKNNVKIFAPKLSSSYKSFSGTSISCAYVSGLCAILYEYKDNLKFKDVLSILKLCSENLDLNKYEQGNGIINLNKLIKESETDISEN